MPNGGKKMITTYFITPDIAELLCFVEKNKVAKNVRQALQEKKKALIEGGSTAFFAGYDQAIATIESMKMVPAVPQENFSRELKQSILDRMRNLVILKRAEVETGALYFKPREVFRCMADPEYGEPIALSRNRITRALVEIGFRYSESVWSERKEFIWDMDVLPGTDWVNREAIAESG